MKKVIFVCIVSFAVCFVAGNSIPPAQSPPSPTPSTIVPKPEITTLKPSDPDKHEATTKNQTSPTPTTTASPTHVTPDTKPDTTPTTKATPAVQNVTSPAPPSTITTPAAGSKNDSVPSTPQSTPKTDSSTKAAEPEPKLARGFDGPSFIGGIILTLGLLAIGFMGFKYYKNQTERNYHTL